MSLGPTFQAAVARLQGIHRRILKGESSVEEVTAIVRVRDEVLARYQPVFSREHLGSLTEEDFRSFLLFKNNHHWMGLHRMGGVVCQDMVRLREALGILLDEDRPVRNRLNVLIPRGKPNFIPRLGRAILTPILLVAHPNQYGVMNRVSINALELLDLKPAFQRGTTTGERYEAYNRIMLDLCEAVGVDLWTLDALWWHVDNEAAAAAMPLEEVVESAEAVEGAAARFGLEVHLHQFLFDNWDATELGRDWALHEEEGEVIGSEFQTDIGRIDLLARHRTEPRWLVVELKRAQTSDTTIGQVLRYVGWVQRHLAEEGESVEGLIIAHQADARLDYALMGAPNVGVRLYEVEFRLRSQESRA